MTYVHVNLRRYGLKSIVAGHCPDCKRRTRFIGFHQEWYGWDETCLRCGRGWQDGEWLPLEFERGVRARRIRQAKATWRNSNAEVLRRAA